jgi:ABC-type multidrug transport system fused ATPase/permease subunit
VSSSRHDTRPAVRVLPDRRPSPPAGRQPPRGLDRLQFGHPSGEPAAPEGALAESNGAGRSTDGGQDAGAPTVSGAPEIGIRGVFRRFWPFARPYRRWLVVATLFVILNPALDTAAIWMFKVLVDDVLTPHDFSAFPRVAAAYTGLTVLIGVVSFADRYLSVWVAERFLADLRGAVYRHLHTLSLDFFERRPLGDILSRLTGDVAKIEGLVLSGVTRALSYALRILFFGAALVFISWQLALVAVVVAPVFWAVSRGLARRLKQAARDSRRETGALSAAAEEGLGNTALVRAYNKQDSEVARFQRHNLAVLAAEMRWIRVRGILTPIGDLLELLGLLLVIGFGTWQLSRGQLSLGEMLAFMAYFGQMYSPLRGIGRLGNSLSSATASAERIVEILDTRPAVQEAAVTAPRPWRGGVSFEDVTFRYPGQNVDVVEGVTLTVEPGQMLALVGSSGAGKSTIGKLLLRHYDATAGSICIGGSDVRSLALADLRETVCVVMQETLIFDGTIRENILWGRPNATPEAFETAVEASDVDTFVQRLPDGYETRVGQRGRRLSGGQRQRVAIARAMLRDPPILLLDEPTTGLDAATVARLLQPLRRLMAERTTIIISHNIDLVTEADLIVVLDKGRIVEQGKHLDLRIKGGVYEQLYQPVDTPATPSDPCAPILARHALVRALT